MNVSKEGEGDFAKYTDPQDMTLNLGEGLIPLRATFHNPFIIESWRADQYKNAVVDRLTGEIPVEDARDLDLGCHYAANRATRYEPDQEDSKFTPEEWKVLCFIGAERFLTLQHQAPPTELIDYMLSGGTDNLVRPHLESITVSVIKGHMPWEERFAAAGVPSPDNLIAEKVAVRDEQRGRHIELFGRTTQPGETKSHKVLKFFKGLRRHSTS